MPPKGNDRQGESDPGEYGEDRVRDGHQEWVGNHWEKGRVGGGEKSDDDPPGAEHTWI